VGSSEPGWIVDRLFLDSLLFLRVLPPAARSLLDLGSGAGLPGVPLKIVRTDLRVTLLESRQRRASFLSTVSRELGFEGVRVVCARAENVMHELGGSFDAVVARCAGHPDHVIALGERLARPGGVVLVSGPPRPTSLRLGEWVTTEGIEAGTTRRFAVHTAAA